MNDEEKQVEVEVTIGSTEAGISGASDGPAAEESKAKKQDESQPERCVEQVEYFGQAVSEALQGRGNVVMVRGTMRAQASGYSSWARSPRAGRERAFLTTRGSRRTGASARSHEHKDHGTRDLCGRNHAQPRMNPRLTGGTKQAGKESAGGIQAKTKTGQEMQGETRRAAVVEIGEAVAAS